MAYVGDTRSRKLLERLELAGCGQMIIRGRLRGRRLPLWAYDNGAFEDHKAERPFDEDAFLADMRTIRDSTDKPAFYVIPDVVGDGERSLVTSMAWIRRLKAEGLYNVAPAYFAVQDGQCVNDLPLSAVDGIFLGGSLDWKVRNAATWARSAKWLGKPIHYARCGTRKRIMQAQALGFASIDSSLPLWSDENMRIFLDALAQRHLFDETASAEKDGGA